MRLYAALLLLPLLIPAAADTPSSPFDYKEHQVEGWTVLVQDTLEADTKLRTQVLDLLRVNLWQLNTRLPEPVAQRLQQVVLRFHLDRADNQGAAYHPSAEWLRDHDLPENWARGIEFGNAQNFLSWSMQQPAMVLHELSHAWHHQVLGYEHQDILKTFAATRDAGTLDQVLHVTGSKQRAYALNNEQEFFAEMSEAWWSTNDLYPFVRGEVLDALPEVSELMEACWRLPQH